MTNNKKCKACSSLITIKEAYHSALQGFLALTETEIKIILAEINDIPFNEIVLHYENNIKNVDAFFQLCEKVNEGFPLQYALGKTEFLGLSISVDPRVLIPRSETEELVLIVEDILRNDMIIDPVVADICTGSGAIAIALKARNNGLKVYASDISKDALDVANVNIKNHHLDIECLLGDALNPIIDKGIKVDYIVANPPYVNTNDEVGVNVRKYEPHLALFSDDKKIYENIFRQLPYVMRGNQILLAVEINEKDGQNMLDLAHQILGNQINVIIIKDIHRKDRFVVIRYQR